MWILFAGIGVWFFARSVRCTGAAGRVTSVAHGVMGFGMAFGMDLPAWIQVAVFAPMALWFAGLATVPHRSGGFTAVHHALMAAAMVVMSCLMSLPGQFGHQVYVAFAGYFLIATLPLVARPLVTRPLPTWIPRGDAIGHAAMTLGAAVLFLEMV